MAKHLLAVLDPDGRDRFDPDAETRRELTLMLDSTGMVGLRGWLTAIPGAMLTALIDHYAPRTHPEKKSPTTAPSSRSSTPGPAPNAAPTP